LEQPLRLIDKKTIAVLVGEEKVVTTNLGIRKCESTIYVLDLDSRQLIAKTANPGFYDLLVWSEKEEVLVTGGVRRSPMTGGFEGEIKSWKIQGKRKKNEM
jgi:hypothetical protein